MDKSKKKRENPFANYLWQTEELLWMGRPLGQRWRYFGLLPAPAISSEGFDLVDGIRKALTWAAVVMWLLGAIMQHGFLLLLAYLTFFAILPLLIVSGGFFSYLYPKETVFYAITNRRILTLIHGHFHEMQHELILVVGIKQVRQYQTIIWDEGQVDFFPDFVGVEDSEYLVHLVEEARGKKIPIVQKSWRDTIICD